MRRYFGFSLLFLALWIDAVPAQAPKEELPKLKVVKAGRLVDVVGGKVLHRQLVLIDGDTIKAIADEGKMDLPASVEVIDLQQATVLPGLIDCHTHITTQMDNYLADTFRKSPIDTAILAHVYARRTLEAGFTTCRDVGAEELVDVALKKAINSGKVVGPRLFVAGLILSATGGHGDLVGFSPYLHFNLLSGVVDGVDEIRKKIRWDIKYGADFIKFTATAGVLSEEESVGAPQFSLEEMKAMVDEAAMWDRRVAAHAHGPEGIKRAVLAGVVSIEHGSLLDDECIHLMLNHGTYLVPTVYVGTAVEQNGSRWKLPEKLIQKAVMINARKREGLHKAIQAGVKIAYGTDAGVFPHGQNAADFRLLVESGMTPMAAIQSATCVAATLLGKTNRVGSLQPGQYADLIAVIGDPTQDVTLLEKVAFVMKEGTVYRNELGK